MKAGSWNIAIMVVLMLANSVDAQSLYACWGGCYNKCFLGNVKPQSQSFACDYLCLNTCIPPTPTAVDFKYYYQIGCSLKRCIPVSNNDGARLEKCFGWCTNLCNGTPAP